MNMIRFVSKVVVGTLIIIAFAAFIVIILGASFLMIKDWLS